MKNFVLLFLLSFLFVGVKSASAQEIYTKWPQLKDMHTIMSETFHPAEEGDFKPIRTRSGELAGVAEKLFNSPIPNEFDKPAVRKAVAKLNKGAKELDKMARGKTKDKKLMKAFEKLHDVFHEISGLCTDKDEHKK